MTMHNASAIVAACLPSAVIEREHLKAAFDIVKLAVEKRNSLPILSTVKMTGDGMSAMLVGADLDLELSVRIPGAVDSRFAACFDAHKFADLLRKAPAADMVAFTAPGEDSGDSLAADFERVTYKLPCLPVADFPILTHSREGLVAFDLPGDVFRDSLAAVAGAVSTEETRYYLNGVYMHGPLYDGAPLVMVATDGHRLYRQTIPAPEATAGELSALPGVIVPRKAVATLLKLLKGKACPASVSIEVTGARIAFAWEDVRVVSKVIDGTFPDYQRVIPTRNEHVARISGKAFGEGIAAVSTISSERWRAFKATWSAGKLALAVNSPDCGSAHTDVACTYDGDGIEIGWNASYMADALAVAGEAVCIAMGDPGSPCLVTGDRDGWTGVLMPMRI